MKKHYRQENNCLNCGTELSGKFCHNCGQENLEIKESFGHMLNHAVSRSLRVVYHRSRFRTITKMIGVGISYLVFVTLGFVILAAITAVTGA